MKLSSTDVTVVVVVIIVVVVVVVVAVVVVVVIIVVYDDAIFVVNLACFLKLRSFLSSISLCLSVSVKLC